MNTVTAQVVISAEYNCRYKIVGNRLELWMGSGLDALPEKGSIVLGKVPDEFVQGHNTVSTDVYSNLYVLHDGTIRLDIVTPIRWMYHNITLWRTK